jgi:hypothetical protein
MDTVVNASGDAADQSLPSSSKIKNAQRFTATPPILLQVTVLWHKSNRTWLIVRATDYSLCLFRVSVCRLFHCIRFILIGRFIQPGTRFGILFPGSFPMIYFAVVYCYADICYSELLSLSSLLCDL